MSIIFRNFKDTIFYYTSVYFEEGFYIIGGRSGFDPSLKPSTRDMESKKLASPANIADIARLDAKTRIWSKVKVYSRVKYVLFSSNGHLDKLR